MTSFKKLLAGPSLPALHERLRSADLSIIDIGGRGTPHDELAALAPVARFVTVEPDPEEAARLEETLPTSGPWRSVRVLPCAIAGHAGTATLYLTRNRGFSSLLRPDARVAERFGFARELEVEGTIEVTTRTLDAALEAAGVPRPSFLKLDTQGTELQILESGAAWRSAVGLYVEGHLQPFYEGQGSFSNLDRHLTTLGFSLASLNRTTARREPLAVAYSRRVPLWCHALYFREPADLAATSGSDESLALLTALALAYRHYDLAHASAALLDRRAGTTAFREEVIACAGAGRGIIERKAARYGVDLDRVLAERFRDRSTLD